MVNTDNLNSVKTKTVIKFADDLKHVSEISKALKENEGYCPCRLKRTPDTKCMCKEFREMEEGICHCGMYQKIIENNC